MKRPASAISQDEPSTWPIPGLAPYHLRASGPGLYPTREGAFHGVDFEVVRKGQGEVRSNRRSWCKPLKPAAELDSKGRCDLHLKFSDAGSQWHTLYHRVVALTMLKCFWSSSGKLLRRPYSVSSGKWQGFQVHHIDSNTRNVAIANLAVLPTSLHKRVTTGALELQLPQVWPYVP